MDHRTKWSAPALVLLLLGVGWASGSAHAGSFDAEAIECRTLENGLRVVVKEAHSAPIVAVDVYVRFGAGDENEATSGVAHALERLIVPGEEAKRTGRLVRMIESLGGRVVAATSRDHTHFGLSVSSEYFGQAVTQLAMSITHPDLEPRSIQRQLAVIAAEIRRQSDDALFTLREKAYAMSFTKHGYRLPLWGTEESVAKLDRPALERVHGLYYTGPSMTVVVVGDVSAEEAFRVVGEAFAGLSSTPAPETEAVVEPPRPGKEIAPSIEIPGARTFFTMGFAAPGLSESKIDVCATDVLMAALSDGAESRFQARIIQGNRLAEFLAAMYLTQEHPGVFYVWAVVPEGGIDAAVNAVLQEIADLRAHGLTAEELERAKSMVINTYATQSETYMDQAGTLGFYDSIDSYEFATQYEELVRNITLEDIERVAFTYLNTDRYALASIIPSPREGVGHGNGEAVTH